MVCIATDSEIVASAVDSWGGIAYLTSSDCTSGTERISTLIERLEAELILNVQGDEPLIDPLMLDELVLYWDRSKVDMVTPVFRITAFDDLVNTNVVKVARAADKRVLYFSRQPIPFNRDLPIEKWLENTQYWGHVGVYAYRRDVLAGYSQFPSSKLEKAENLEQLRFLEAGVNIYTIETAYQPLAVDTYEDLQRLRDVLRSTQ